MYINRQDSSHQEDSQFTIAKEIVQGSKKRNMYRQALLPFSSTQENLYHLQISHH